MSESNADVGQRIQEKFQFYVLGLIFTLLGLAVQTASFGNSLIADILELLAWGTLLVSALAMMNRLEWTPQIYKLFDLQQDLKSEQKKLRHAMATGAQVIDTSHQPIDTSEFLEKLENRLNTTNTKISEIDSGAKWKYTVHKAGFLIGLIFLIAARAHAPISSIIGRILGGP